MTDIEAKALALVNEVREERGLCKPTRMCRKSLAQDEALCRAIEQHEAFRQEVSDAVREVTQLRRKLHTLARFIIAKPDPLEEALREVDTGPVWDSSQDYANKVRAALAKRGLEIVEKK